MGNTVVKRSPVALRNTMRSRGLEPAPYPAALGRWPAAIGFAGFVWLELVLGGGDPRTLFLVLLGYTAFTLVMMAQFGRDTWRANAEVFTVWFRLLGRLAPYALVDESGRVRRRTFASGLLEPGWTRADVAMIALGVGSILFDGLSQTQIWFDVFGRPANLGQTLLLGGFLAIVVAAALLVVRAVGVAAACAGLLPIAVGYLVAHYLTYLLIDGQRILIALADPFQQGWALLPTAFHEPTGSFLPPGLVWTVLAFTGAFGIIFALIWVNVLVGGLVNGMFMLLSGPMIDKLVQKPAVVKLLARFGVTGL